MCRNADRGGGDGTVSYKISSFRHRKLAVLTTVQHGKFDDRATQAIAVQSGSMYLKDSNLFIVMWIAQKTDNRGS